MTTNDTILAVFPAHAGMSRRDNIEPRAPESFPRTRGDEPDDNPGLTTGWEFSPHTRG